MPTEFSGITEQLKKKLAGLLPTGYDAELARVVKIAGQIQPVTEMSAEDKQVVAAAVDSGVTAGGPDPITDGRPTIMRVVAWMCHEGVNRNGDAFVKEELAGAAAKVSNRNPLVMDWNHAAIVGGPGRVIGVWSKLDYAFDMKARDGMGAWGILAEGVMFAWAYPDIADQMLAEQQRNQTVDFSMACIPSSVEFADVDGKRAAILHNPVFFTLSALDVPPGDPDAVGVVKEGDNGLVVEEELKQQLTGASVAVAEDGLGKLTLANGKTFEFKVPVPEPVVELPTATLIRTANMEVKLSFTVTRKADGEYEVLAIAKDAEGKELAQSTYALVVDGVVKAEELTAKVAELVAKDAELTAKIAEVSELKTLLDASKISYAELETALTAAVTKTTELEAALTAKSAELDAAMARLAEIDAEKAELQRKALLETRLSQLPEAYREAHSKREEVKRAELELEWSKMADEAWAAKLEDISLALPQGGVKTASYLERSRREGVLPVAAVADTQPSISDRCQKFTRSSR